MCVSHRVGVGSWEGRNFYQIRPRLQVCNFYKIRPEIWDQLLQFKGQISNFPPPPSAAPVFLGPNFRFVRLDFVSVQDFGILVGEHDAGIKSSKNEFLVKIRGKIRIFFWPAGAGASAGVHRGGSTSPPLPGDSSFYRCMARSAAFPN